MTGARQRGRRSRDARAFSLVEAAISLLIVSVMLIAGLNTVGVSKGLQVKGAQRNQAMLLAEDLMSEIVQRPYEDPDQAPGVGLEPGENDTDRLDFDDVDDYDGWTTEPPLRRDGTAIAWASGYERRVSVVWLDPDDLVAVVGSESGVKGIRVEVWRKGNMVTKLNSLRTATWADPISLKGKAP